MPLRPDDVMRNKNKMREREESEGNGKDPRRLESSDKVGSGLGEFFYTL